MHNHGSWKLGGWVARRGSPVAVSLESLILPDEFRAARRFAPYLPLLMMVPRALAGNVLSIRKPLTGAALNAARTLPAPSDEPRVHYWAAIIMPLGF